MTIKPVLLAALEAALNQYLALAENSSDILTPLAGKVVAVTVTPFNQTFFLCPTAEKIQVLDVYVGDSDTQLSGSLMALGLMRFSANPMNALFSGQVKIDGDVNTGRKFQELFVKLDLNLEGKLARLIGTSFAHHVFESLRASKQWSEESLETFKLNFSEFLQEETRDVPAKAEADGFFAEVDNLRLAFDRLEQRIVRLEKSLEH